MRLESAQNLSKLFALSFSKGLKLARFGQVQIRAELQECRRGLTIKEWGYSM
jgi:hypothetical protein